jgi:hypothetical protein
MTAPQRFLGQALRAHMPHPCRWRRYSEPQPARPAPASLVFVSLPPAPSPAVVPGPASLPSQSSASKLPMHAAAPLGAQASQLPLPSATRHSAWMPTGPAPSTAHTQPGGMASASGALAASRSASHTRGAPQRLASWGSAADLRATEPGGSAGGGSAAGTVAHTSLPGARGQERFFTTFALPSWVLAADAAELSPRSLVAAAQMVEVVQVRGRGGWSAARGAPRSAGSSRQPPGRTECLST